MSEPRDDRLAELLSCVRPPAAPPELRGRVMAAVRGRPRWPARPARWTLVGAAATLLVVVMLRPAPLPMVRLSASDFGANAMTSQHSLLAAGAPLGDGAALYAVGALAERAIQTRTNQP